MTLVSADAMFRQYSDVSILWAEQEEEDVVSLGSLNP
jgi:hypothetical protein